MAANTTPIFTLVPVIGIQNFATANTNRDGSGTIATLVTAGADGTRIEAVEVVAQGTTTAGAVRLFIHDGANARLYKEIQVSAVTPAVGTEVWRAIFIPVTPIILPNTYSLRISTNNAETFNAFAFGGSYS